MVQCTYTCTCTLYTSQSTKIAYLNYRDIIHVVKLAIMAELGGGEHSLVLHDGLARQASTLICIKWQF